MAAFLRVWPSSSGKTGGTGWPSDEPNSPSGVSLPKTGAEQTIENLEHSRRLQAKAWKIFFWERFMTLALR